MTIIKTVTGSTNTPIPDGMSRGVVAGAVGSVFAMLFIVLGVDATVVAASIPLQLFLGAAAWGVWDKLYSR